MNHEDDPELSAIDNQRRRYASTLIQMGTYFDHIGYEEVRELGKYIATLGVALEDLIDGVTDPLFMTKGSKRDSMRIWSIRLQAALGLECFIRSGLPRKEAAEKAADKYKMLRRVKRGVRRDLAGSLLSWYDRYVEERVPVPELLQTFKEQHRAIKAANVSAAEYRKRGDQWFARAVKSATR